MRYANPAQQTLRSKGLEETMELYACGFNASNQLQFGLTESAESEPDDIAQFTKILTGRELEKPVARLSQTTGEQATLRCRPPAFNYRAATFIGEQA